MRWLGRQDDPHDCPHRRDPHVACPSPASIYRLQLTPGVGLDEVAQVAPYLARLDVSHAYLSSLLEAVSGSTDGYDVVDHTRLRTELGSAAASQRMRTALGKERLGVIGDVAPNTHVAPLHAHGAEDRVAAVIPVNPARVDDEVLRNSCHRTYRSANKQRE